MSFFHVIIKDKSDVPTADDMLFCIVCMSIWLFQNNIEVRSVNDCSAPVEQVLEEVTEVNEVQPQITLEQEENIISTQAAEGDTYVIDTNPGEDDDDVKKGYYLSKYCSLIVHNTSISISWLTSVICDEIMNTEQNK